MSILSVLDDLSKLGVTPAKMDAAISESAEIRGAVMEKAQAVQEYWKQIAPVNKTGRPHTLKSGYVDEVGAYRDSIHIQYRRKASGFFSAKVGTVDYKAHWLEYGSVHNPEFGFAQRVVDHFGGSSTDEGFKSVGA